MKALTLTQPWAGLVAAGIKLVENRPRRMIKREDFGKPFAIHASREIDESVYARIAEIDPDIRCDWNDETRFVWDSVPWYRLSRITGAVIAVATIERCVIAWSTGHIVDASASVRGGGEPIELGDQRRWFFGPIGYVLRDVRELATPVPCRGQLGFWTLPGDVERAVEGLAIPGGAA